MSIILAIIYFIWTWVVLLLGFYFGERQGKKVLEAKGIPDKAASKILKSLYTKTIEECLVYEKAGKRSEALHCAAIAGALDKSIKVLEGEAE